MKLHRRPSLLITVLAGFLLSAAMPRISHANPTADPGLQPVPPHLTKRATVIDRPNPVEVLRIKERRRLQELLRRGAFPAERRGALEQYLNELSQTGSSRVLVILVEFGGTDVFTWSKADGWDPIGKADPAEASLSGCNYIAAQYSLSDGTTFRYSGPLHNQIPRPLSADDASGDTIWSEDFSPAWFDSMLFGDGVRIHYSRQDSSTVDEDFTGKSARHYYEDQSNGRYTIDGDIVGWLSVPHSTWWYGADPCPGRRSGGDVAHHGGIPGAGDARTLVTDALDAVNAADPNFDWTRYDGNGDGLIDHLWIVHAGYGEEDSATLLNRTVNPADPDHRGYGEAAMWSHSWDLASPYLVDAAHNIRASHYIMMPENGGIAVFTHEFGHALGAADLYAYTGGETSTGFWSAMADDWTGYPLGFQPPSFDPLHLDYWGWLDPLVITDPTKVYTTVIGQTSEFPGGTGVQRGVRIDLPDNHATLPVQPSSGYYWWGGREFPNVSSMTSANAISLAGCSSATLRLTQAYSIEENYDYYTIKIAKGSGSWEVLDSVTGDSAAYPSLAVQQYDLAAYLGQDIRLRFEYETDAGVMWPGVFLDRVAIECNGGAIFTDTAASSSNWTLSDGWERSNGTFQHAHRYYLQWRNTGPSGGYDSALGDSRWRYGPANTGLVVWYNNDAYTDNELMYYMDDAPSFGAKGMMLVVDAHPEPYRNADSSYKNELGNLNSRGSMRDAPFSQIDSVPFTYGGKSYPGRSAVNAFHDALGFYPGVEWALRAPAQAWYQWFTVQWDASVVLPATRPYSVLSRSLDPANPTKTYANTDYLRFACEATAASGALCYGYDGILNLGAGPGAPGENGRQYGWHARVLSQQADRATVRIWNSSDTRTPFSLAVQTSGPGKVTSAGGAINCGASCTALIPEGTTVTLQAQGDRGILKQWGGACSGAGDCSFTASSDVSVSAEFTPCYSLDTTASPDAGGAIEVVTPPNCGALYRAGTAVTLRAQPAIDYVFTAWEGAAGDADAATVVMDTDRSVSASFTLKCYPVNVSVKPARSARVTVKPKPNCEGGLYTASSSIQLRVFPKRPHRFRYWARGGTTHTLGHKRLLQRLVRSELNVTAMMTRGHGRR